MNGSAATGKNKEGKSLIGRAAALVGVFSHLAFNNDNLCLPSKMQDGPHHQREKQHAKEAAGKETLATLADVFMASRFATVTATATASTLPRRRIMRRTWRSSAATTHATAVETFVVFIP